MKIVVTGSTGLVGTALVPALVARGHEVVRLVRADAVSQDAVGNVSAAKWHPERGEIDTAALAGCDAAVHLAGENISEGRWTDEKKRRIIESRRQGTRLLAETLAQLTPRPRALVVKKRGAQSLGSLAHELRRVSLSLARAPAFQPFVDGGAARLHADHARRVALLRRPARGLALRHASPRRQQSSVQTPRDGRRPPDLANSGSRVASRNLSPCVTSQSAQSRYPATGPVVSSA